MALLPLATSQDVADIWRALSSAEQDQAENLISKASALLRNRLSNIDDRIALSDTAPTDPISLDASIVANVVAGMVKRVMVNPVGAVNTSVTVDGVSRSQSFVGSRFAQPDVGLGELTVTDADVAKLTPKGPSRGVPQTFRIKPTFQPAAPTVTDGVLVPEVIEDGSIYGPYFG